MKPELAQLLLAACVGLVGLAASAMLLLHHLRHNALRGARIDAIVHPYRVSRGDPASAGTGLSLRVQTATLASRIAQLLRYNASHRVIYPAPPIVILLFSLLPGAGVAWGAVSFVGPLGWAILPIGCVAVCRGIYGWFEDRLVNTLYRQFPDSLAMIVRAVRVGLPMVEAIRVVARENPEPTAREFAVLVAQTAIGVPLDDALRDMAERNHLAEYRFFATALSLQSQTGGGLTETLENLADTIRKRVAAKMRGHALAAEARMSAYVLGALPIVTGFLLVLVNPGYMAVMFTDPSGRILLMVGIAMLATGAFIMRTMIRKSLT